MEKERPSHKWTSDDTIFFCEILADLVNNFMGTIFVLVFASRFSAFVCSFL